MTQTRLGSLIEACANVAIGYSYALRRWFNARLHTAAMRLAGQVTA